MANLLFIPLVLIVGYLLLVRPQQQRVRRQQELLDSIRVGDEVITAGGMVGRVESLDTERVRLELAPGMTVQFLRQAIARKVDPPAGDATVVPEEEVAEHGDGDASLGNGLVERDGFLGGSAQIDDGGDRGTANEQGADEERGERT